jgi:hypothetical protein
MLKNTYIIIFLFIIVIIYYKAKNKNEKYLKLFPPMVNDDSVYNYYIVNTVLKPLRAPIKIYKKDEKIYDLFIYNQKYFCPVRNQGECGACWAFIIASLLSDGVTLRIINFGKNLSVQDLLTCYPDTDGCQGAEPENVLLWLEKTHFKISINNYYSPVDEGNCIKMSLSGISVENNSVISLCTFIEKESDNKENKDIIQQNIYNMKRQILESGPVYATITIYSDFLYFKGNGVYKKKTNNFMGGHALQIVGWCDEGVDVRENFKEGYWVCKNTWGIDWCPEYDYPGYIAIRMGYNECGIESRCGSASPNVEFIKREKGVLGNLAFTNYNDYIINVIKLKKSKNKKIKLIK